MVTDIMEHESKSYELWFIKMKPIHVSCYMVKTHVFWGKPMLLGVFHAVNLHFLQTMFHVLKFMHCMVLVIFVMVWPQDETW